MNCLRIISFEQMIVHNNAPSIYHNQVNVL